MKLSDEDPVPASAAPENQSRREQTCPDWFGHLPYALRQLFLRYGWLGGVYIAFSGLLFIMMGLVAKYTVKQMFGGIDMELMMPGYRNPMNTMGNLVRGIGAVRMVAGIALALWLRNQRKKDE